MTHQPARRLEAVRADGGNRQPLHALVDEHDREVLQNQAEDGPAVVGIVAGHDQQPGRAHIQQLPDQRRLLFNIGEGEAHDELIARLIQARGQLIEHIQPERAGHMLQNQPDHAPLPGGLQQLRRRNLGLRQGLLCGLKQIPDEGALSLHALHQPVLLQHGQGALDGDAADLIGLRKLRLCGQLVTGQQRPADDLFTKILIYFSIKIFIAAHTDLSVSAISLPSKRSAAGIHRIFFTNSIFFTRRIVKSKTKRPHGDLSQVPCGCLVFVRFSGDAVLRVSPAPRACASPKTPSAPRRRPETRRRCARPRPASAAAAR